MVKLVGDHASPLGFLGEDRLVESHFFIFFPMSQLFRRRETFAIFAVLCEVCSTLSPCGSGGVLGFPSNAMLSSRTLLPDTSTAVIHGGETAGGLVFSDAGSKSRTNVYVCWVHPHHNWLFINCHKKDTTRRTIIKNRADQSTDRHKETSRKRRSQNEVIR